MTNNLTQAQHSIDTMWRAFLSTMLGMAFLTLPMEASATAAGTNPIEQILCNIVAWVTGGVGRAIATIAIVIVGIGALMGKISWGMALIVALGIAIVFGAATLVDVLGAQNAGTNCDAGQVSFGITTTG
jgi:type IV secretory pathway VirB2 component (pilin)